MALSRHHAGASRPLSIEEIVREASNFEFIPARPLKSWLRSAQMLLTEAAICEQDGDLQRAYLYLYRHAELVLGKFPQHPEFREAALRADVRHAQKTVQTNLAKLEEWKPKIMQQHERYVKAMERRNAERQRVQHERYDDEKQRLAEMQDRGGSDGSEDGHYEDSTRALNANEHRELAVDLAHREIRRRDATKASTRKAGISPGTVAARRRGVVVDSYDDEEPRRHHGLGLVGEGIKEAGRHLHHHEHRQSRVDDRSQSRTSHTQYQYPSVPAKEAAMEWKTPALQPQSRPMLSGAPPALPAKQLLDPEIYQREEFAPPIPAKSRAFEPPSPPTATPSPPPGAHPPSARYTFKPSAFTESGAALRTVLLPPDLRTTFLNIAHPNTLRNFETGGILCGTLISNALFINHLVIPDQISTSDTCDTTEEGDNELFDFCDSNDLLVCGWIHTHPSQSCFLSSRDLHTSSGYQVMLPEAIAIVCAPKHNPDWGIFRLTEPPGLNHVLNCTQKALFHPHSETNLYTDALRPGHVVEGPGLKFEVVDLRRR
jgi:STAM-binding protein